MCPKADIRRLKTGDNRKETRDRRQQSRFAVLTLKCILMALGCPLDEMSPVLNKILAPQHTIHTYIHIKK